MTSNNNFFTRRFLYSLLILIALSTACGKKKHIQGKEFVPRETMLEMLVEMHLIDGITNDIAFYKKYNPNDSIDLYGKVYVKHEVSREKFDLTMEEYLNYPYLLDELYADVLNELKTIQQELDRQKEEERQRIKEEQEAKTEKELPEDVREKHRGKLR